MENNMQLSRKSQDFLDNLRIYLFSSGKKSDEIDAIVEELENHLSEAEKNGKSVDKIIGNSRKEYMKMISDEMVVDYRTMFKYICVVVFGSFSFTVFLDLLNGNLAYSILEMIGHITIAAIFIATILIGFKYISTVTSLTKQIMVYVGIALLPMVLFIGLIYLNKAIATPVIHFGQTGSIVIGLLMVGLLIGISIWAKTIALIIITLLLIVPEYVLSITSLQEETQLILSTTITFVGIGLYLWILTTFSKK